jgi:predicted DNA-binding protein YlxM (UPF0122 family)
MSGHVWKCLERFEHVWKGFNMSEQVMSENIWKSSQMSEHVRKRLNMFEKVWICLEMLEWLVKKIENVWTCSKYLKMFENVRRRLNIFEHVWKSINSQNVNTFQTLPDTFWHTFQIYDMSNISHPLKHFRTSPKIQENKICDDFMEVVLKMHFLTFQNLMFLAFPTWQTKNKHA